MKFILDTNIWISSLINQSDSGLLVKFLEDYRILILSDALLLEISETASHPKFRKYFSIERLKRLLHNLKETGVLIGNIPKSAQFKDSKDEFLLDLCQASQADFLVTGD